MESESVRSTQSDHSAGKTKSSRNRAQPHRSNHRSHSHKTSRIVSRSVRSLKREDPSCGGGGGGVVNSMAPFQTAVTMDESREEVIEVQILPQDENWGENTTAVTGNTSDQASSVEEMSLWPAETEPVLSFPCTRFIGPVLAALLTTAALASPVAMILLPRLGFFPGVSSGVSLAEQASLLACGAECKGLVVSLVVRLALLVVGVWALYLRSSRVTLPSLYMYRTVVLILTFIATFVYWLFYIVQITEDARESATSEVTLEYKSLVSFASSLTDTLLFIHYISVILMEIRHLQPVYYVKVVRSPDGESRSYAVGEMSIQRAAVWILDRYYTEFPVYNPYLERLPVSKSKKPASSFKYYDLDPVQNSTLPHNQSTRSVVSNHSKRRDSGHNERFYEEHDYERRVKKRRARLITATEDAFAHVKKLSTDSVGAVVMDAGEAAQAVFPSLARALQKYLRVTRQQPRHTVDSILQHLAQSITYDLSPRAFLERFLHPSPVLQMAASDKERREVQSWSLVSEDAPTRRLRGGCLFQVRQNDVSLLCTVHPLPYVNLQEDLLVQPASSKFLLRMNSETSV